MKYLKTIIYLLVLLNASAQSHKKINFTPTQYYSRFSAKTAPVLTIQPGDTLSLIHI